MNVRQQQASLLSIFMALVLLFGFVVLPHGIEEGFASHGPGLSPRAMPELAVAGMVLALAYGLIATLIVAAPPAEQPAAPGSHTTHPLRAIGALMLCLAFAYGGFSLLGFYLGGMLMAMLLLLLLGERQLVKVVVIPILTLALIYCIFELGFQVRLPKADFIPGVPL